MKQDESEELGKEWKRSWKWHFECIFMQSSYSIKTFLQMRGTHGMQTRWWTQVVGLQAGLKHQLGSSTRHLRTDLDVPLPEIISWANTQGWAFVYSPAMVKACMCIPLLVQVWSTTKRAQSKPAARWLTGSSHKQKPLLLLVRKFTTEKKTQLCYAFVFLDEIHPWILDVHS